MSFPQSEPLKRDFVKGVERSMDGGENALTVWPMKERAFAMTEDLRRWRRHIHAHPELSFQEYLTAEFIQEQLSQIDGLTMQTGIGGTGIIAELSTGEGPIVAIRADMDALPIVEETAHEFCSQNYGVMHACGHDGHSAILIGVVHLLEEAFRRGEAQGTVRFLFQPAEEATDAQGYTGAPYMVAAGALEGVEAVMALHMDPERPTGVVRLNDYYSMASVDTFRGVIRGTGGHGAYPHLGTDPLWMLGPVLQALHGIVARRVSPLEPTVVTVGQIHGGTASNVIPQEVVLEGTIRSYSQETREYLMAEVERAFRLAEGLGGSYQLDVVRGEPALFNHPAVNKVLASVVGDLYAPSAIQVGPFGMGGEDFAFMCQTVPGALFFLGCAPVGKGPGSLHAVDFDLDEMCLPIGASILAESARRFLTRGTGNS